MKNIILFLSLFILILMYVIFLRTSSLNINAKDRVMNVYLYIILGLLIVPLVWALSDEKYIMFDKTLKNYLIVFLLSIVAMVFTITSKNKYIKHISWGIFMITCGIASYITYKKNSEQNKMYDIILKTAMIVGILSYVSYTQPLGHFDNWYGPLMNSLLLLIAIELFELAYLWFYQYKSANDHADRKYVANFFARDKLYSWFAIILFSGFILYDTQKLLKDSSVANSADFDYPSKSLGLTLDILNLFTNVSKLN